MTNKLSMVQQNFSIMQLTDIHIGEYPFNADDEHTFQAIETAVSQIKPNLIMITGDLLWSDGVTNPQRGYQRLVDLFNHHDYPIAITYGNHDSEETLTRANLLQLENQFYHRAKQTHYFIENITNKACYTLEIFNKNILTNVLYVFDSGDYPSRDDIKGYDWISLNQIDWYEQTHKYYSEKYGKTNDLVFLHIPLPEYQQAGKHIIAGNFWETNPRICSGELNTGLFSHIINNDHVAGIFCGHDHDNNFDGIFMNTHLVYGNVSGYNCYGDLPRGYRMINLGLNTMETRTVQYH